MTKDYDNWLSLKDYVRSIHCFYAEKPKKVPYGFQAIVAKGRQKVTVTLFKTGAILIQGKPSELKKALESWKRGEYGENTTYIPDIIPAQPTAKTTQVNPIPTTITKQMIHTMRIDYAKGASCDELAARYKVTSSAIEYIVTTR
jgi:hypothetical protein